MLMAPQKHTFVHSGAPSKGGTDTNTGGTIPRHTAKYERVTLLLISEDSHQRPIVVIRRSDPTNARWHKGADGGATSPIRSWLGGGCKGYKTVYCRSLRWYLKELFRQGFLKKYVLTPETASDVRQPSSMPPTQSPHMITQYKAIDWAHTSNEDMGVPPPITSGYFN